MRRLLALLSVPPPDLKPFILFPAVMVFGFMALSVFDSALARVGLSSFVLAVVVAMGVTWAWQLPAAMSRSRMERSLWRVPIGIMLAILGLLLVVNKPLWCQRVFTVALVLKALFLAYAMWRKPSDLVLLGGPNSGPKWFTRSWSRWKLVSLLMLVLMNEAAIRFGTLTEWMVVWSVAPLVAYSMMHWTIVATWEDEAEGD